MPSISTLPQQADYDTPEQAVQRCLQQEAKKSLTIGAVRNDLRGRIDRLGHPYAGAVDARIEQHRTRLLTAFQRAEKRLTTATRGSEQLHVDAALSGTQTQGYAYVGQGAQTIRINPDALADVGTERGEGALKNLIAHERSHAEDQEMMGDVFMRGKITGTQVLERRSERAGAEVEGKSGDTHRENQPSAYAAAQDLGGELEKLVGQSTFDERVRNGDTVGLQADVIKKQAERHLLTPEMVQEGIRETGQTYRDAFNLAMAA